MSINFTDIEHESTHAIQAYLEKAIESGNGLSDMDVTAYREFARRFDRISTERATQQETLSNLQREVSRQNSAMREFQRRVRDKAIAVSQQEGWCRDGLNEALESLGLEKVKVTYKVSGKVRYEWREVSWDVEATSEDEAREEFLRMIDGEPDHSAYDSALEVEDADLDITEGELR